MTLTYFAPGINEGALWALQMFESSGHLPFLQETIDLLNSLIAFVLSMGVNAFVVCRRGCSQPHSPSQLTCASFCRIIFSRAHRSVSAIIASSPARNIALSLFQTSLSQSPLDTQLEWATRRRVPMFKVVPNMYLRRIFWSSWCR